MGFSYKDDIINFEESSFNEVVWIKVKWQCVYLEVSGDSDNF